MSKQRSVSYAALAAESLLTDQRSSLFPVLIGIDDQFRDPADPVIAEESAAFRHIDKIVCGKEVGCFLADRQISSLFLIIAFVSLMLSGKEPTLRLVRRQNVNIGMRLLQRLKRSFIFRLDQICADCLHIKPVIRQHLGK